MLAIVASIAFSLSAAGAEPQLLELLQVLEDSGFTLHWEQPPLWGAYGLLNVPERSLWIHPVVFELKIAQPTVVHEAVHAAQLCAAENRNAAQNTTATVSSLQSIEDLSPLGLGITPSPLVRPYILRYTNSQRRQLELEAYALQAEVDGVAQAIALLQTHCNPSD